MAAAAQSRPSPTPMFVLGYLDRKALLGGALSIDLTGGLRSIPVAR
jgi:hypothetical protein